MKKIIIAIIISSLCCVSAFAGNMTMGYEQGIMTSTYRIGYDFGRWFEVGGGVGVPVVMGITETIGNIFCEPEVNSETGEVIPNDPWYMGIVDMVQFPRAEVYLHFKAVETAHFDLRLGVYAWAHASIENFSSVLVAAFTGPCLELSYRFNDSLRLYLNGNYPLLAAGDSYGDISVGNAIGMLFMSVFDVAHIGLSWTL